MLLPSKLETWGPIKCRARGRDSTTGLGTLPIFKEVLPANSLRVFSEEAMEGNGIEGTNVSCNLFCFASCS